MPSFFYDKQLRRYILQFLRCFAEFKIELPPDANGVRVQRNVPIRYGDMSRQVAQILRDNAQNTAQIAPSMAGYITNIELAADRRQDPMNVNKKRVLERQYDPSTGEYTSELGNRYMVESYMPTPYNLIMNLDIWTTNTTDKMQLFEQIACVFNPTVQIQTHDNPIDWSTITEVELTGVQWTNRSVPVGTDSSIDIMTLTFKVPVWISPPAKLTKQTIVEQINVTIFDAVLDKTDIDGVYDPLHSCFDELVQVIVTPGNHKINVSAIDATTSEVELLDKYGNSNPTNDWRLLFSAYGRIDPENTRLRLKTGDDIEDDAGDILGSLAVSETEVNKAIFTVDVDTLPFTLPSGPVTAIIDPTRRYPGSGLPPAIAGQRYLLLDTQGQTNGEERLIGQNTGGNPWGSVDAWENDIIEYNGTSWFVSFSARAAQGTVYVRNIDDGQHYRYEDDVWAYTYIATYNPGYFRIEQ
jgi:hypothetical protein